MKIFNAIYTFSAISVDQIHGDRLREIRPARAVARLRLWLRSGGGEEKKELTAEQKTEIRDCVEGLKTARVKAEQGKATPAAPVKTEPKRMSQAKGKTTAKA